MASPSLAIVLLLLLLVLLLLLLPLRVAKWVATSKIMAEMYGVHDRGGGSVVVDGSWTWGGRGGDTDCADGEGRMPDC